MLPPGYAGVPVEHVHQQTTLSLAVTPKQLTFISLRLSHGVGVTNYKGRFLRQND